MKTSRYLILFLVAFAPLIARAQLPPAKAYEAYDYQGKLNGRYVKLILADCYIQATEIQLYVKGRKKPVLFQPEYAGPDAHNQLKFTPYPQEAYGYFVLDNILEAYPKLPFYIRGTYYQKDKKIPVKFRFIRKSE